MKYNIGDDVITSNGLGTIVDLVKDQYKVIMDKSLEYIFLNENQIKLKKDKIIIDENKVKEQKMVQYSKQISNKHKKMIKEGLRVNDLQYLVEPFISIDQYTSKINPDDITIALFCNEKYAANDLVDFIEKMYFIEILDVEVSETMTDNDKYIVYVEVERNLEFPKFVLDLMESLVFLTNNKAESWQFQSFGMEERLPLTEENIKNNIRLTEIDVEDKEVKVKETVEFSKNNLTRTYLDEGVITKEELDKYLSECELLNENSLDKEILEYNLPEHQIITADDKIFVISDDIRMLGVK